MGEGGMRLGPGDKFFIGADDSTYMVAGNNGFTFNGYTNFSDEVRFLGTGSLKFGQAYINNNGITMSGNYYLGTSGDAYLNQVTVQSLSINGTTLENYIKSIIRNISAGFTYKTGAWEGVAGTSQPVTISIS